jgi:alpha-tubulin suppressor-like RCC1 family protein
VIQFLKIRLACGGSHRCQIWSSGIFSWGPGKPGYTLSPLTFNVWRRLGQLKILARRWMMPEPLNLVVEQDQAGLWRVTSPNIPGLLATGHSRREALSNVDGAISHLQRVQRFAGIVTDDALRCGA